MTNLRPAEYQATIEKIARVNARAIKRGFTGRLEVAGTQVVERNVGHPLPYRDLPEGAEVVWYETTITGDAPCYEGWEFVAALDSLPTADGSSEWIVRCAPGVTDESVDRRALRPGACDHCDTSRPNRRKLYLVRNIQSGDYRQVGATCIKDFLGWDAAPVFISPRDLDDELGGGRSPAPAFTPRFVVVVALATVTAFGWVPRSRAQYDPRAVPTSSTMTPYLIGPAHGRAGEEDREVIAKIQAHIADAEARADELIATVLAEFADSGSGYEANLRAALRAEYVDLGQMGLLASIVPAYERIIGRRAERQAQPDDAFEPEYLGEVGDRVEISGVITTAMTVDGYAYGTTQRLVVVRTDSALVKFCSSAAWTYDVDTGDQVTITATIKRLDVWRERKQTVVVRPKLVAPPPQKIVS